MSTRTDIATTRFLSRYNCAQAVLDAFGDEAGLDEDLALKIATGLGADTGRKQEVCGAATGGILVLGVWHAWLGVFDYCWVWDGTRGWKPSVDNCDWRDWPTTPSATAASRLSTSRVI